MTYKIFAADIQPDGTLRIPKLVRQVLRLTGRGTRIGFIIQGRQVLLTRTRLIPDTSLSDKELAALAQLSKRGTGKRTFQTAAAALKYLWSL